MEHGNPGVSVILRVSSGKKELQDTLDMLNRQSLPARTFAFCLEPSENMRSLLSPYAERIYTISRETYETWSFLNRSMETTDDDIVVFLDESCVPVDEHWLEQLTKPCRMGKAGASFSRKLPVSDASPLIMNDLNRIFDETGNLRAVNGRHWFTQDAFSCRRSVWEQYPFWENSYGPWAAFAWSWHIRKRGVTVEYVKHARVLFDESYRLFCSYRRAKQAADVEARLFSWEPAEITRRSYWYRPCFQQIREDLKAAAHQRKLSAWLYSPILRWTTYCSKHRVFRRAYAKRG